MGEGFLPSNKLEISLFKALHTPCLKPYRTVKLTWDKLGRKAFLYWLFYEFFCSSCMVIDQKPLNNFQSMPLSTKTWKSKHKDVSLRSKLCPPTTFQLLKSDKNFLPVLTPCRHKSTTQTRHPNGTAEINSRFLFSSIPQDGIPAGGCTTDFTSNA